MWLSECDNDEEEGAVRDTNPDGIKGNCVSSSVWAVAAPKVCCGSRAVKLYFQLGEHSQRYGFAQEDAESSVAEALPPPPSPPPLLLPPPPSPTMGAI